ncbi:MAG: 1-acyl-sn-glycerol-3-phosphate acyltransferase [Mycoplasma sp.]|nr:1-acyl-sn-glycerol-3-phosphate acyltransferase [Mycoplasma sp.]
MKKFFKTIGWALSIIFVLLIFAMKIHGVKRKCKKYLMDPQSMSIDVRYHIVYKLAKYTLFIKRYSVESQGTVDLPNIPSLYVANHKSFIDPIVLFKILYENAKIPYFRFVAKQELLNRSFVSAALKLVDTIFINRSNFHSTFAAFNEINFKKDNRTIIIFPEGTRIYDAEKINDFHPGSFRIAYNSLIPIIPVAIVGLNDNRNKKLKSYKNKSRIIYVSFLKQIKPQEYGNTNINYTATGAHDQISDEYMRIFNLIKDNKKHIKVFEQKDEPTKEVRY